MLKKILADEMQKKHEELEKQIKNAPNLLANEIQRLEKGIKGEIARSEKNILNKKQEQENLVKIWNEINFRK